MFGRPRQVSVCMCVSKLNWFDKKCLTEKSAGWLARGVMDGWVKTTVEVRGILKEDSD